MSDRVPRESTQEKSRLLKEKLEERAKAKEIRNSKSKVSSKSNPAIDEHDETSDDYSDAISNPDREPSLVGIVMKSLFHLHSYEINHI